ncbi:MAG: ATP-dependent helicase, partial [Propionibacterium sp.]|nr:ATP-dependent helicase [Propionibacterium sp.]
MWTLLPPQPPVWHPLTPAQAEAARPAPGVTVVLGAPGSGKTHALTSAVVERLQHGVALSEYAVLASSRAAAQAARRDIVAKAGTAQASPVVTTVHGLALGLLRQFQPSDEEPWALLRAPQQEQRIRELLAHPRVAWPAEVEPALGTRAFARQLREVLARVRQRSWDEERLALLAQERGDATLAAIADFLDEYLAVGDLEHTLDYAELVYRARLLLLEDDVAHAVLDRFRGVFVDDAHDLDPAQASFLADLARLGLPLLATGDPQQVVSGFRGATGEGLARLLDVTPSRLVELEGSHRHGDAVAAGLRSLRTRIDATGAPPAPEALRDDVGEVSVRIYDDESSEAAHVADELRRAVADGASWSDCAVIMRAGRAQLAPMARDLLRLGIPVEVAADELVLSEEESVTLLLLALKVAARGGGPDADQARLLLTSKLGGLDAIGLRRLGRALLADHAELGHSEQLLGRCLAEPELLAGIGTPEGDAARALADLLGKAAAELADGREVQLVLWDFWTAGDWPEQLRRAALSGSRRAGHQLDAVVELFERAARDPVRAGSAGALTFIGELAGEEIPADTGRELSATATGVQLTTAHRSKGQEWP